MPLVGEGRRTYHWGGDQPTDQRLTVAQAADQLGITEGAVRSRIKRGTLATERVGGRVYVLVGSGEPIDQPGESTALISEMRGRIEDLREQLEAERKANEENRRIIAALTSRIPELEAPTPAQSPQSTWESLSEEPRESSEMHMPEAGGGPRPRDQQTPSERPWWRRVLGG